MIRNASVVIATVACAAAADELYTDSLASDSGNWDVTRGNWMFDASGMSNSTYGENRAFVDVLNGATSYAVEFTATLHQHKGWGVWLSTDLSGPSDRATGYTFQYDPGWSTDSYLLRDWQNNHESVLFQTDLDVEYGQALDFRLEVDGDEFRAYQEGHLVMQTDGLIGHPGDLIGFRTWAASEATFSNLRVSTIPAPPAGAVAIASIGVLACVRVRRR